MKNESGILPVEYRVLVLPDVVKERTQGGIILPDLNKEMQQWAQVKCTLAAVGGKAFEDFTDDERSVLIPGARIYCRKYEGINILGADGKGYRLINDKDIGALVTDEGAASNIKGRSRAGMDAT